MKVNSTFHVLVFLMAVLTFSMPFVAIAQEGQWELGVKIDAERDAEANTSQVLWIGGNFLLGLAGGCVLGSVGLLGAHLYEPPVPTSRLVGKSPEYVLVYADAYKAKARDLQIRSAFIGCLGGSVVSGCVLGSYYYSD